MEAGAQLQQRRDASVDLDLVPAWRVDAGHELEQRALPRAIAADQAERLALRDGQVDVAQGRQV